MRWRVAAPLALVWSGAVVACTEDYGSADGQSTSGGGDASTDGTSAGVVDGGGDGATSRCPSGRGPKMVLIEAPGVPTFCIDSTEVTRAQYLAFLDTGPTTAGQAPECAWNTTYAPPPGNVDFSDGNKPIAKVDWCDAVAFCKWAGKRLCGALGSGARLTRAEGNDPLKSEWMVACSRNGARPFPYGQTEEEPRCNTDGARNASLDVASQPGCTGAYDGLFDMAGNVTEWDNACDDLTVDGGAMCRVRGGSWATHGRCDYGTGEVFRFASSDWGIRCCATAAP